jgi:chemotaxis protein CheD
MSVPTPAPADILEIFLQPGEFYFGEERTRIRTLLGSCVAIALWHPRLRIGGMCHYMLPHRPAGQPGAALDGRYADEAMRMFMRELDRSATRPADYRARLFGAGQMLSDPSRPRPRLDICARNIEAGRELIVKHQFHLGGEDVGGEGHRNVILDLWSGDVWLKRAAAGRGRGG